MWGLQHSASPLRLPVHGLLANLRAQRPNVRRGCLAETEHLATRDGYGEPPPPPRPDRQTAKKLPQQRCAAPDARLNGRGQSQIGRLWGCVEAR